MCTSCSRCGYGIRLGLQGDVETQRDPVRQCDGAPLPTALRARLKREWQKVQQLTAQIESLEAERRTELRTSEEPVLEQVRQ
jgi:transposase